MYCFFFLKQKWKKWQYQYQCQSFLLYYRKNIFSTIGFLKSKRVSLCHKRKLPSLIKFRKKHNKKEVQNRTIHTKKVCNVRSVRKWKLLFWLWILVHGATRSTVSPLPVERHYQQDLEHFLTSDPAFIWVCLYVRAKPCTRSGI